MPGMPPIGKTLFYTIANNITGGGKLQEARAGVDYLKVNFHSENFTIIDKVIDVLAPLSDIDHTLRYELLCLRSDVFTFLSYGFAVHVKSAVQASDDTVVQSRTEPQEHEAHQFAEYKKLGELLSQPDLFDEPATQESFIFQVQNQLNMCASIGGSVAELGGNNCCASTHSPAYALDLVPDRRPNMNPKLAGHMDCSACRGTFLFYDRLRRVALSKLDQDPTRLAEIADMLLSIHQCERRTFRYMMLAAQQSHKMKQVIAEMDSSTAYVVFDFKQKFLAKGFREGGDSYYGKKGMLWFGVGVYIKPDSQHASYSESPDKLHVEMDFTADVIRLQQEAEMAESVCDIGKMNMWMSKRMRMYSIKMYRMWMLWVKTYRMWMLWVKTNMMKTNVMKTYMMKMYIMKMNMMKTNMMKTNMMKMHMMKTNVMKTYMMKTYIMKIDVHDEDEHDEDVHDEDVHDEDEHDEDEHDDNIHDEDEHDAAAIHFIDCIVQGEQRADGNIVLSCLEAAFHALRQRFPYVSKIIVQSDNAKNLAGKQTKLLLPYVCSAAGLKLLAYYHNEAQSGKDVCDTHFSHQQTQVDTYLVQGDGSRKVSTPKQLAVALITNSVKNTTVLLVKPDFHAPCRTAVIPAIPGISGFYAANYITTDGNPEVQFFHSLGQKVPLVTVLIPSCPACSLSTPMGSDGVNFTGVTVLLNSDSKGTCVQQTRIEVDTRGDIRA